MSAAGADAVWQRRMALHQAAIVRFLAEVQALDEAVWPVRPRPAKWSPGQIAEHVMLTYEAVLRELQGGLGMRERGSWWRRFVIRRRFLPMVLEQGRLPEGAPAVREIRPGESVRGKAELAGLLRERAARFEEEITSAYRRGGVRLTHPFFGRLGTTQTLALLTAHTEHHRRQLPNARPA